jgi:hypothetical protein
MERRDVNTRHKTITIKYQNLNRALIVRVLYLKCTRYILRTLVTVVVLHHIKSVYFLAAYGLRNSSVLIIIVGGASRLLCMSKHEGGGS